MYGFHFSKTQVLVSALALGSPALGQSFNIDIGGNQTYGVPASSYGAGAAQPGTWNDVSTNSAVVLFDLSGMLANATFTDFGNGGNYESDNMATFGDDEALLDDFTDLGCTIGDMYIRVTNYAGYDGAPAWSPNGTNISFESYPSDPDGTAGTTLWTIAAPALG